MSHDGAITLGLFHLAIKTSNLDATRAFWVQVIGLREVARPDFGFPGAWLACPQPGGQAIIHVYAGGLVPGTSLWQLFVYDPSGVQLELTFEGSAEDGPSPDMSPGRAYVAGSSFFSTETYPPLRMSA